MKANNVHVGQSSGVQLTFAVLPGPRVESVCHKEQLHLSAVICHVREFENGT